MRNLDIADTREKLATYAKVGLLPHGALSPASGLPRLKNESSPPSEKGLERPATIRVEGRS
jgi:hypothetical protein